MAANTETSESMERRFVTAELRASKRDDDRPVIEGIAAVYDQETEIAFWREKIRAGAFTRVLGEKPDTVAALNHDWNIVLGRTLAGTLRLEDSADGLHYSVDINPDDPEAMSVYAKVKRGDIRQSSFAFTVNKEEWSYPEDKSLPALRTIIEIGELFDVSPVTFPAYPTTSVSARSKAEEISQAREEAGRQEPAGDQKAEQQRVQERLKMLKRRLDLEEKA